MKLKYGQVIFVFFALSAFVVASQWKYIPEKASIKFKVITKNNEVEAEGVLLGLKGTVEFDSTDVSKSSITAHIDVKTINTGIEMRDESLRSSDFFNVSQFPTISFISKSISKENNQYLAKGNLKIKNTTKEITIPFTFKKEDASNACFEGTFSINRLDYKVGEKGDGVGEKVDIQLFIPVQK